MAGTNIQQQSAVIGYGSFGRMHARKYLELPGVRLAGIVDNRAARREVAAQELPGIPVFPDIGSLLETCDIELASVVVPATAHFDISRQLLEAGTHLLVEKPLTTDPRSALTLDTLASRRELVLQPGYLERFNDTLEKLHTLIPSPRYIEARRMTSWRDRGTDVDVIMDLMIHDIDMLLELVTSPLVEIQAHGSRIFSGTWDVANARLVFANGCVANLTASRASPQPERRLHIFAPEACALTDIDSGRILVYQRNKPAHIHKAPGNTVRTTEYRCRNNDPLREELLSFVCAVRDHKPPLVTAHDACRAIEIALHISEFIENDDALMDRLAHSFTDAAHALAYLEYPELPHG